MIWLKRLLKKRKAKQYFKDCVNMLYKHECTFSNTGSLFELQLMDYWRKKAEEALKEYDSI